MSITATYPKEILNFNLTRQLTILSQDSDIKKVPDIICPFHFKPRWLENPQGIFTYFTQV